MKYLALVLVLLATPLFAQTTSTPLPNAPVPQVLGDGYSTASISASAIAMKSGDTTVVATILRQAYSLTTNLSLHADEIVAPNAPGNAFMGGARYFLPLSKELAKTNLNPNQFQFYCGGDLGVVRGSTSGNLSFQHYAGMGFCGSNYDPTSSGNFSMQLVEVGAMRLPGIFTGWRPYYSAGAKLSF